MSKPKIVMAIAMLIVVVTALGSFSPTAYSQPTPTPSTGAASEARQITIILPSGETLDFKATPDQLQAILTRVIGSTLGQTAAAGENETAIKENLAVSLKATLAAADVLGASNITAPAGFQMPGACVETFGVTTCIDVMYS